MALKCYQLALAAGAKRLSDAFTPPGNEMENIPYRQLLFTATGAAATIGDSTVTATKGVVLATTAPAPMSIGPFTTGPVKLSDIYAIGAGSTLTVVGVPF